MASGTPRGAGTVPLAPRRTIEPVAFGGCLPRSRGDAGGITGEDPCGGVGAVRWSGWRWVRAQGTAGLLPPRVGGTTKDQPSVSLCSAAGGQLVGIPLPDVDSTCWTYTRSAPPVSAVALMGLGVGISSSGVGQLIRAAKRRREAIDRFNARQVQDP